MEQNLPHEEHLLPEDPASSEANNAYQKYKPLGVIILIAVSILLFLGIHTEKDLDSWESYRKWGYLPGEDIWNGKLWALLTSNFIHIEFWHIAFNLYWLWQLGKKVEFEKDFFHFLWIAVTTGIISSIVQLAFSDTTGIGLSGIVYGLFGYILLQSKYQESFKGYLTKQTIYLFLIWLVFCLGLTYMAKAAIGNAGHVSGIVWGILLAYVENNYRNPLKIVIPTGLLLLSLISVAWAPWSMGWLSNKAYKLHQEQKLEEALLVYNEILAKDPGNSFALENKKAIEIDQISKEAYDAHQKNNVKAALKLYQKILVLDPQNQWAKENMEKLDK